MGRINLFAKYSLNILIFGPLLAMSLRFVDITKGQTHLIAAMKLSENCKQFGKIAVLLEISIINVLF